MYLADYHAHSRWSVDARIPMAEMALAAAAQGLDEICFTDHVEVMDSGVWERNHFDWAALEAEYAEAQRAAGSRILIRLGVELGEAPRDFAYAEKLLAQMPPLDFIIGSQHQLSEAFGCKDLYFASAHDEQTAETQIQDYLEQLRLLAAWGRFSVMGHMTLPLRYMNENNGLHMSYDGHESEMEEIFRLLIQNGCGIELNTNRGGTPLPDGKWLRMYRALGGEIITLGSDGHTPAYVGYGIREGQELLRACGFRRFCTFERMHPVWHEL